MSYVSPKTGRQYVLVTVPGQARPQEDNPLADTEERSDGSEGSGSKVIAYALPQ